MSAKESWSANQEGGFTLLEVIAVLTLLLLLVGLVYPVGYNLQERFLVKLSLAQLKEDLLALRDQALGGGERPVLVFTPGAEYYQVQLGALALERPLAGLSVEAGSEVSLDFSRLDPAGPELTFRTARGERYRLTLDEQGKPEINPVD